MFVIVKSSYAEVHYKALINSCSIVVSEKWKFLVTQEEDKIIIFDTFWDYCNLCKYEISLKGTGIKKDSYPLFMLGHKGTSRFLFPYWYGTFWHDGSWILWESATAYFSGFVDFYVFGPPGSVSQRYGSGSGSFHHQAKIVRKNLDFYCFVTSLWLFNLWRMT